MSEFFNRFSLQSVKFGPAVGICVVFIWIAVVWCTIASIFAQPFSARQRIFWIVLVVLVPLFGVLAYLPFSVRREDLPHSFLMRLKDKDRAPRSRPDRKQTPTPRGGSPV